MSDAPLGVWVYDRELRDGDRVLASFSSHWAACAAMIRLTDPTFKSLGGDKPEDLAIERALREGITA